MAFDAGSVIGRAILDDSKWVKGSKNVQNSTGKMVTSMFTAQAAFAAVQKVIQVTTQTIQKSITAFVNQEKVEKQLNAVLKSTKNAAGLTANEIKKMAEQFQKTTTFEDDAVLGAQNLLLTFTKIGKEVFPDATETVLNMSQALGQDLKSSAIQLGKALNDPIIGATALRRVGVSLTQQQMDQIKVFQKSGNLLEAQKIILNELAVEFGGAAKAARETFGGALKSLQNLQGDVLEDFGRLISITAVDFVNAMSQATEGVHNFLSSEAVINKVTKVSEILSGEFLNLADIIQKDLLSIWTTLQSSFNQLFGDTDLGLIIVQKLAGIISNLGEKISLVTSVINFYIKAYTNLFSVVRDAVNVVKEFIGVIDQVLGVSEQFDKIKDFVKPIVNFYKDMILNTDQFIRDIGTAISGFFGTIVKKAVTFISNIAQPVIKFLQPVIDIIKNIVNTVQGLGEKLKGILGDVNFEGFNKSVENLNKSTVKLGKDTVSSLSDVIFNASKVYDPFDIATKENTKKITQQWDNMNKNIEDRYKDTSNNLINTTNETTNGIKTALMSQEEVYDELNKMIDDFKNKRIEENNEILSNLINIVEAAEQGITDNLGNNITDAMGNIEKSIFTSIQGIVSGVKTMSESIAEGILEIIGAAGEAAQDIYNTISGLNIDSMQNELTALKEKNAAEIEELEEQKEKKLEQIDEEGENKLEELEAQREAGIISEEEFQEREKLLEEDTANRKAELDKKLSEQILATKKKQIDEENAMEKKIFEAEKANQIANIWISAALGIVAAWAQSIAQLGPIAGAIFAGILTAAILGVAIAQTVVISQQQFIPKKAKGGKTSGLTEINEGGRGEIVNLPDNSLVIPNDISRQIADNVGENNGNNTNISFKGAVISDMLSLKKVTDYVMQRLNTEMRRG